MTGIANRLDATRSKLEDAQGHYEGVEFADDVGEQQEGLNAAGLALVDVIGDLLELVRDLRAQGADLADFPGDLAAALLVVANTPKIVANAVADMRMIEDRLTRHRDSEVPS